MGFLKEQSDVSPYRGMPVEENAKSGVLATITGETVQFYYSNAGVRTIDAGQAAGVVVEAVLAKKNVKNKQGKVQATVLDSSLSFTSTAFTTEVQINYELMESLDNVSWSSRLSAITSGLANGEYVVDYKKGVIYGKKASTQTTLTACTYQTIFGESTAPAASFAAITPSDATNFTKAARGIYVGGAGNVVIVGLDGAAVTFVGATAGSVIPAQAIRVNSTNTTATSLVALF